MSDGVLLGSPTVTQITLTFTDGATRSYVRQDDISTRQGE